MLTKICCECKKELPLSEFGKRIHAKDGLQSRCKKCKSLYEAKWYKDNTDKRKQITKNDIKRKRKWLKEYKSTLKCEVCGESHPACLDFHHRDGDAKIDNVGNMIHDYSITRVLNEIEKCDVLCKNCHAKLHYKD